MDKKLFMNMCEEFNRRYFLELPEIYTSLYESKVEITLIKNTQILFTDFQINVTLDKFETAQLKNIFEVISFFHDYLLF